MAVEASKSDKPTLFEFDDDDEPVTFKRQTASKKNLWHSDIRKSISLGHNGQSHRQISDNVPSSNGQSSSSIQKGNIVPSAKALPLKSSVGISKASSTSFVNTSSVKLPSKPPSLGDKPKPILQHKMSIDVKEGTKYIKHHAKDNCEDSEDKEDDKPLSARLKMNSNHDNNAVFLLSSEDSDYDGDDDIPLSAKLFRYSNLGTFSSNCDHFVQKKPISNVQKEWKNGSGASNKQERPSTLPGKRPLDKSGSFLHSSLKKTMASGSDPAASINTKLVSGKSEPKIEDDDDDDIPISQRIKNSATSVDKSSSINKKLIKVTKCGSPSFKRQAKKLKRSDKDSEPSAELDLKEKELALVQKSIEECQMKRQEEEQRLHFLKGDIEECSKELENKKNQVGSIQGQLSSYYRDIETKEREYGAIERSIEERNREFEVKGEQLKSIQKLISESERQLRSKEEECNKKREMVQKVISECYEIHKKIEECDKDLGEKEARLSLMESLIRKREQELKTKERELHQVLNNIDKDRERKEEELKALIKKIAEGTMELKNKEEELDAMQKLIDGQAKEQELQRQKSLHDNQLRSTTDGRSLQLLSSVQTNKTELLANDVLVNLKASSDPAKVVLDIIQNPLVPKNRKGDNAVVVDSSQVFLLEQLMRISPHIKPHVREEAMSLALDLKANIRARTENSLVVLGFLLLVSIYGLVSSFNEDEVLKLFKFASQHKQAVQLFRTLGFVDKASDFVENLIKRQQHIEAVRFICAYKLIEKNQPVDLLQEYVQNARLISESSCKNTKSIEIKVKAIDQEIASLQSVLQCISENNIESQDLHKEIQDRTLELERQKANSSVCSGIRALLQKCNNLN